MEEKKKRNYLIVVLIIICIVLISISIMLIFQTTECNYKIEEDNYSLEEKVVINYNKDINITRNYKFKDEDVLEMQEESDRNDKYKTEKKNNNLISSKNFKFNTSYKEIIKKYKKSGYSCKMYLFKK